MERNSWPLGVRPADLVTVAVVIAVIELNVTVGGGFGARPLNAEAYVLGPLTALPLLLRRRWPLRVLWASCAAMILFYVIDRRNISPAPSMAVPVYEAALVGYLAWSIAVPTVIMMLGLLVVGVLGNQSTLVTFSNFLPEFAIFALAVALGEVIRGRRALAAETARRLRLAEEERRSDAARLVAEERLRIARELHDTVAHSMATIAVQAGSALHVLSTPNSNPVRPNGSSLLPPPPPPPPDPRRPSPDDRLREALLAIRETSKSALAEMRTVLGQLRSEAPGAAGGTGTAALGLSRLPELRAAVAAAGSPVTVTIEGEQAALPPAADHAAYRILQESLTNVLRHAPPGTPASVRLRYSPESLMVTVANDTDEPDASPAGNGIRGMRERAASVGGSVEARPVPGGFAVTATIPRTAPVPATAPLPEDGS